MHVLTESLSTPKQTPEPEKKITLHKNNDVRLVRFLLSPPPEESMGDNDRKLRDRKVIVRTTDPKAEEPNFGSANGWGRRQLQQLGVQFVPNAKKRLDLNKVLYVDETQWPTAIQQRVRSFSQQLAAIDSEKLKSGEIDDFDMSTLAPQFSEAFLALSALMTAKEGQLPSTSSASAENTDVSRSNTGQKRPRPLSITTVQSKRPRGEHGAELPEEPKTPDQPTRPANPNFTTESSATVESQPEETTKKLLVAFLGNTIVALGREFNYLYWQQSGYKVHLFQTGMDRMKFRLGCETVNAINDGGLNIRYNLGKGNIDFRPGGVRPVLSLEAKRRKSKRRNDPELPWQHAGQIFAEMLGQVCYKDFYENPNMDYQEAFVIHGSHSSITIYYCRFPNQYLSEISRFGKNFLTRRSFKDRLKLLRTKKFSFRDTNHRVELFNLLAKLLWYLVSGKSRVGYLHNYPDNPLHNIGKVFHDTIVVERSPCLETAVMVGEEGNDSFTLDRGDESVEENDSSESFSASEAGGDVAEIGGVESAGEEDEDAEGEIMDMS